MTTLAQIRAATKHRQLEVVDDPDSQCYRATAPAGQRFEGGLHEVIAVYGGGLIGNGQTKADARADLFDRVQHDVPTCEACDDPECDWCRPPR